MKKREEVSIVNCKNYDPKNVRKAIEKSLEKIGFKIPEKKKILLKPNLLSPQNPEKAITTNPVIVEELCKMLKKRKNEIIIGDSSAHDTNLALKKTGMLKLKKYGKIINFESEKKKMIKSDIKKISQIGLPQILFDVDLIINLPKLKTHSLTKMTCAIKNLYGCIPGNTKEYYHKVIPHPAKFSEFLVDIYDKIKPGLNILDGVVGIEGQGPGASGDKKKTGLIMASKNSLALDLVAAETIGYKPKKVWTNKIGLKKEKIKVVKIGKMKIVDYKKPETNLKMFIGLLGAFSQPKISFDKEKCKKCHLCEKKCPMNAITLKTEDGFPECNHEKCIRCLCCIEVCPHKSIYLEKDIIRKGYEYLRTKFFKF